MIRIILFVVLAILYNIVYNKRRPSKKTKADIDRFREYMEIVKPMMPLLHKTIIQNLNLFEKEYDNMIAYPNKVYARAQDLFILQNEILNDFSYLVNHVNDKILKANGKKQMINITYYLNTKYQHATKDMSDIYHMQIDKPKPKNIITDIDIYSRAI